jgi:hypothetical protein
MNVQDVIEQSDKTERGKTGSGSQRYRCMFCQIKYTPEPKVWAYPQEVRRKWTSCSPLLGTKKPNLRHNPGGPAHSLLPGLSGRLAKNPDSHSGDDGQSAQSQALL